MMSKISLKKAKNLSIEINNDNSINTRYDIKGKDSLKESYELNKRSLLKSPKYN